MFFSLKSKISDLILFLWNVQSGQITETLLRVHVSVCHTPCWKLPGNQRRDYQANSSFDLISVDG